MKNLPPKNPKNDRSKKKPLKTHKNEGSNSYGNLTERKPTSQSRPEIEIIYDPYRNSKKPFQIKFHQYPMNDIDVRKTLKRRRSLFKE